MNFGVVSVLQVNKLDEELAAKVEDNGMRRPWVAHPVVCLADPQAADPPIAASAI